ncbi:MAG TPA: phosphate ABC transporter substrate-binding protein PstS [bacterium]|nr:phosphate ABC transporter substrate-binding protein PstS [bacterium]
MKKTLFAITAVALTASTALAADKVSLTGAGATFPYPLYSKWFSDYNKMHSEIEVNYQSIGSGGGIKQITEKTVDFGASDAPMSDEEMAKAAGILHIPTTLGAVVVTFNVKGVDSLRLSPDVVAGIFLGDIKSWDDAKIKADNPKAKLPKLPIALVHRSDGSGTSYVFTDYLSQVSADWKSKVGTGKSVNWPVGIGAKGNEGVSGQVKQLNGSIGYVELAYAMQNKMAMADLKNHDGEWVKASTEGMTAAADAMASKMPEDMRVSIINAPGKKSYPISAYTYILVYKDQADAAKGKALTELLNWAIHEGQKSNEPLFYAKLPESVVKKDEAKLRGIQHDGKPFLAGS